MKLVQLGQLIRATGGNICTVVCTVGFFGDSTCMVAEEGGGSLGAMWKEDRGLAGNGNGAAKPEATVQHVPSIYLGAWPAIALASVSWPSLLLSLSVLSRLRVPLPTARSRPLHAPSPYVHRMKRSPHAGNAMV